MACLCKSGRHAHRSLRPCQRCGCCKASLFQRCRHQGPFFEGVAASQRRKPRWFCRGTARLYPVPKPCCLFGRRAVLGTRQHDLAHRPATLNARMGLPQILRLDLAQMSGCGGANPASIHELGHLVEQPLALPCALEQLCKWQIGSPLKMATRG